MPIVNVVTEAVWERHLETVDKAQQQLAVRWERQTGILRHFISMETRHAPGTMKRLDMLTERLPRQGEGKVTRLISHVRRHANGE